MLYGSTTGAQLGLDFQKVPKTVFCGPIEVVFKALADEDINEKPLWIGRDENNKSDFMLFVNSRTKTFTLLQVGKEWACILGIGSNSQFMTSRTISL